MNVLITGANFNNKGAQLMLVSLVAVIKEQRPDYKIFVSPFLGNREKLKSMGVSILDYPLLHYGNRRYFRMALKYPMLVRFIHKFKGIDTSGSLSLKNIDAVFDISGFAFGDKWGPEAIKDLSLLVTKIKNQGTKSFLLPQAFGPFTKPGMRESLSEVTKLVDLLVARDAQSFKFITDVVAQPNDKIVRFPDITLSYKKSVDVNDAIFKLPFCCIVPNERMLDKASISWQENYYAVIKKIALLILENSDLNIVILIHAGGNSRDGEVGKSIQNSLPENLSKRVFYYVEEDPTRLKSLIAKSTFVIGSRFHALASALSSNIPCIGTSWLHKYEMLFEEYGCSQYSFKDPTDTIYDKTINLLDVNTRKEIIEVLKQKNSEIGALHKQMWDMILP